MNSKVSLYLDFLRVLAAFVVVFSHLSPFCGDVAPAFEAFGHVAVIIFFVLSGYVIAYVAAEREKIFSDYAAHRLGRLYSVVIPALILTFVLDHTGVRIAPSIYAGNTSFDHPLLRLFIHGLFLQEIWLVSVRFSSNGPLWSLSYEFFYYAIFGIWVLYRGPCRRVIAAILAFIAGPTILIYGLIWLLGHAAYKIHTNENLKMPVLIAALVFILSLAGMAAYPLWRPYFDTGLAFHKKLDFDRIASDFIFAAFVFINIAAIRYLPLALDSIKKPVKYLAGMSFSLYAFHYPLMLFFGAVNERYVHSGGREKFTLIFTLILLAVSGLSFFTDRKKQYWTGFFNSFFPN